ncbi:hypothetical protein V8G54_028907 [Vigna mungo]|uniref:Protein LOW PSII ACCUMULATION 1, chloroplastic n=1 Tax=Vigna mungo TaxID=3915 RepID=A0AAQ3MTG6_VIGMU
MAITFGSVIPNSNTMSLTLTTQPLNNLITNHRTNFVFCGRSVGYGHTLSFSDQRVSSSFATVVCSAANKPDIRMFFYIAFVASGSLGAFIAITQLIGALANSSRATEVPEILKGLAIDIAAVSLFAFLYFRENKAKNAQVARLSREESLSNLKLRVDEKKIIPMNSLRGIARLVICAGPASFVTESFKRSEPFTESLLDRGVLVVPLVTDGNSPAFEFEETGDLATRRKRLWQLAPVYINEWSEWLDEQKKLAGVPSDSPVYLSLRMDGRVRGSGVGYPPWNALVAQLPSVKGMWTGLLDGMDGRVL